MKVIVVGCGRMGLELVSSLSKKNYSVVAIDTNPDVFVGLPLYHNVTYKVGVGFDKEVLESAGIAEAASIVACTNSDEVNAVVARVAKEFYRVPQVIARLYSSKKARIYDLLGIQTISTTEWGTRKALKMIEFVDLDAIATIGSSDVEIVKVVAPMLLDQKEVSAIENMGIKVISILRNNKAKIPSAQSLIHKGDLLYIVVDGDNMIHLNQILGL